MSEILYSELGRTGTFYEEEKLDALWEAKVAYYLKVGLFFGWSWQEFEATPFPVVKRLSEEIDFRLEHMDSNLIDWKCLSTLLAISKAFGGGSNSE